MKASSIFSEWQPDPANPDGLSIEVFTLALSMTRAEAEDLLSRYDPTSGTSPSVADARPVARVILDAVKESLA